MSYTLSKKYMGINCGYPDYTRGGNQPKEIIIHHWGATGQTAEGVSSWLSRKNGVTSAHYVVAAKVVYQILNENDCGWHAGNRYINMHSIGLECRPEMSEGDLKTTIELVADIYLRHGVLPLRGHRDIVATDCPGKYYKKISYIQSEATKLYKQLKESKITTAKLVVDGEWGAKTTKKLQAVLGVSTSGKITGQTSATKKCVTTYVKDYWTFTSGGCATVKKLQAKIGVSQTGVINASTVKALQKYLNKKGANLAIDGACGEKTVKALQKWLNKQ